MRSTSTLLLGLVLLAGCRWQNRPKDAAAIKANYSAFRSALLAHDHVKAASFVSADYLALYPPEQLLDSFRYLPVVTD